MDIKYYMEHAVKMSNKIVHIVLNEFTQDSRVMKECESLAKSGYDVTVIAYWMEGLDIRENIKGYKIIRIPIRSKHWSKNSLIQVVKYIEFLIKALFFIRKIRPDICHGHDPNGLIVAYCSKYIFRSKLIYDSHELWSDSIHLISNKKLLYAFGRTIEKYLVRQADAVITVNQSIADIMYLENSIRSISVISNMPLKSKNNIVLSKEEIGFPESNFNIIYVGNIEKGRGIDITINAMAMVDSNIGLVLMGRDSAYKNIMKNLAKTKNYEHRIKFIKVVEPHVVVDVCSLADVGISPIENVCRSYYLSLPNKIFEYIQSKIPVLASDFPEMKDIIDNYNVGFTFNVESIEDVANVINKLYYDKASQLLFGKNCRIASEELIWEVEEQKLYNVYNNL